MADPWSDTKKTRSDCADNAALVTPNDSTDLATIATALLVGGSGALKITTAGGSTLTLPATVVTAAGGFLPIRVARVWSTGTTATDILALW